MKPMNQRTDAVLLAGEGETSGDIAVVRDRFMISGGETGGRFALVQHLFAPRALAAPMHFHMNEDEYTFVVSGRIGAILGGEEYTADAGDLLFKPRGQWHTFWNAGDEPAVALELISPAGLEELFRELGKLDSLDPDDLMDRAARFACRVDFEATMPLVERHRLRF
jgi:quercetin dioxygenase-like cupin family protein